MPGKIVPAEVTELGNHVLSMIALFLKDTGFVKACQQKKIKIIIRHVNNIAILHFRAVSESSPSNVFPL